MNTPPTKIMILIRFAFAYFGLFWLNTASAAMSGTYSIDPGKTASSTNYQTFTKALNDLYNQGVSGPATFNIADGVYKENIAISGISGGQASNPVVFQSKSGDSSKVIIQPASSNSELIIQNAAYITFKHVTFYQNLPNQICVILNSCTNINFFGCQFIKIMKDNYLISDWNSTGTNSFFGNNLTGGHTGIYAYGAGKIWTENISNNKITNCINGIIIRGGTGCFIGQNYISLPSNNSTSNYGGINLSAISGHMIISGNNIIVNSGQTAIGIYSSSDTGSGFSSINNNMMTGSLTVSYCNKLGFYFNTISLYDSIANANFNTVTFSGLKNNISRIKFYNNIVANFFGGVALSFDPNTVILDADYNDYFTTGTTVLLSRNNNYNALKYWSLDNEIDYHSLTVYPGFKSVSDLHAITYALYHKGLPITGITNDIDGLLRNKNTPDIGANEFGVHGHDLSISQIPGITYGFNCSSFLQPKIIVNNYGSSSETNVPVSLILNRTGIKTIVRDTIPYIQYGSSILFAFKDSINTLDGGSFSITTYTNLYKDAVPQNDTFSVSGYFYPNTIAPTIAPVTLCHPGYTSINLHNFKTHQNDAIQWLNNKNQIIANGDSLYQIFADSTTTFQFQAIRHYKYTGGLKDTGQGGGRYSTKPYGIVIKPEIEMILDSVTVYPKGSGTFYLRADNGFSKKYNVTISKPGQAVKLKVGIDFAAGSTNTVYLDTILTGGMYANYLNGTSYSNILLSLSSQSPDTFYRYMYNLKFTAISPCVSNTSVIKISIPKISLALTGDSTSAVHMAGGTYEKPDTVCPSLVSYHLSTIFPDSTYGTQWSISNVIVRVINNSIAFSGLYKSPTKNSHAIVYATIPKDYYNYEFRIEARVKNLVTGCDTVIKRYFGLQSLPGPTISIPDWLCSDYNIFNAQYGNALKWKWDFGDSSYSTAKSPSHIYKVPEGQKRFYTISLQVNYATGCSNTDSKKIEVDGKPIASFSYTPDVAGNVNFKATDTTLWNYTWYFGDNHLAYDPKDVHKYSHSGTYKVKLTTQSNIGCVNSDSENITLNFISGIDQALVDGNHFNVYPNPAVNFIRISYHLSQNAYISTYIEDMSGKNVMTINNHVKQTKGDYNQNVSLPGIIPPGSYFIKMDINGSFVSKALIISR